MPNYRACKDKSIGLRAYVIYCYIVVDYRYIIVYTAISFSDEDTKMKMNHNDALHILGLTEGSNTTTESIKYAYRRACAKFHPDKNPAGLEMMKLVNSAYEALQDIMSGAAFDRTVKKESVAGSENYGDEMNTALSAIINLGLTIEICGSWIWVSGDTRTHREILKAGGFKYAPKKSMWHFRPADYKSFNRGKWDMDKIRSTHGSEIIRAKQQNQIGERA